jgi:LmbE family N-acetylglucosaminyl deacetylase
MESQYRTDAPGESCVRSHPLPLLLLLLVLGACGPLGLPQLDGAGKGERVLVVAPHIDDETIAAAGFAADALAHGAEVAVVYMTAGDCNRFAAALLLHTFRPRRESLLSEGRARIREGRAAMALLGLPAGNVYLLGYPDGGLADLRAHPGVVIASRGTGRTAVPYPGAVSPGAPYTLENLTGDLSRVLDRVAPTLVLAPVPFDHHPDHAATGRIVRALLDRRSSPRPRLLGYLVHHPGFPRPFTYAPREPLGPPRRFLASQRWRVFPLSRDLERKKHAVLHLYKSQIEDPYLWVLLDAFVRTNELFVAGGGEEEPRPAR